jgi:hypothetical protein
LIDRSNSAGPMPETCSNAGETRAPAAKITSLKEVTVRLVPSGDVNYCQSAQSVCRQWFEDARHLYADSTSTIAERCMTRCCDIDLIEQDLGDCLFRRDVRL